MKTSLSIRVLLGWIVALGLIGHPQVGRAWTHERSERPVVVQLASGRSLLATIAPQTDGTTLWLRWRHGTIRVLRPIDWDRVVRAEYDGRGLSAEQLRRAVVGREPIDSASEEPSAPGDGTFQLHTLRPAASSVAEPTLAGTIRAAVTGEPRPVRSLSIDAWGANWDGDVEVDGVIVDIHPLDADGAITPMRGTLEVTLMGWRTGRTRPDQPPIRLGRWTRSVEPDDFVARGTRYRFPFQSVHPEFDLELAPHATVHARLGVPGQGVFEASSTDVRIRPYSALRDQLQQTTGQRFYDVERTGRSPR